MCPVLASDWTKPLGRFLSVLVLSLLGSGTLWGAPGAVSSFDHDSTAFPLVGAHARAACASCHVGERFVGLPRDCDGCHVQGGLIQATAQPLFHITVQGRCEDCHRDNTWSPVLWVDHTLVLGTCSSCHNNARVAGQPADHIVTPLECDSCHTTRRWSQQ
ncbi:MAG: hypothetical protein AAF648_04325 [Pseudomonadota bacterium]